MFRLNLKNRATTQTSENYNSMCNYGDISLGATSSGLYKINCGFSDNGVAIPMLIKSGMTDFGIENNKQFRRIFFGLNTDGSCKCSVFIDGILIEAKTVTPENPEDFNTSISISYSTRGRYLSWSIENINGSFLSLYSVKVLFFTLHKNHVRVI